MKDQADFSLVYFYFLVNSPARRLYRWKGKTGRYRSPRAVSCGIGGVRFPAAV